jgi:replicative DNA helicase
VKLPYDPEAEVAVLAACLQDTDALAEVVETLSADDFHKPAHRIIFEAACELFGRGDSVDPVTAGAFAEKGKK